MKGHSWKIQKAYIIYTLHAVLGKLFTFDRYVLPIKQYEPNYADFAGYLYNLERKLYLLNKEHIYRIFDFLQASGYSLPAVQILYALSKKADVYKTYSKILFENKKDADILINAMRLLKKLGELRSGSLLMKGFFDDVSLSSGLLLFLSIFPYSRVDVKFLETLLPYKNIFNHPKILVLLKTIRKNCFLEEKDAGEVLNICTDASSSFEEKADALENVFRTLNENRRVGLLAEAYNLLGFFANANLVFNEMKALNGKKDQVLRSLMKCKTGPEYSLQRNNDHVEVFVLSAQTAVESVSWRCIHNQKLLAYVIDVDVKDDGVHWSLKENNKELLEESRSQNYLHFCRFLERDSIEDLIKNHQLPAHKPVLTHNPSW